MYLEKSSQGACDWSGHFWVKKEWQSRAGLLHLESVLCFCFHAGWGVVVCFLHGLLDRSRARGIRQQTWWSGLDCKVGASIWGVAGGWTRWPLRSFPTETIPWFCDLHKYVGLEQKALVWFMRWPTQTGFPLEKPTWKLHMHPMCSRLYLNARDQPMVHWISCIVGNV